MKLIQPIGDSREYIIPLRKGNSPFAPGSDWTLVFTVKSDPTNQDDSAALLQKATSGYGLTVDGSNATVVILRADTKRESPAFEASAGDYFWDIQAVRNTAPNQGEVATVASGTFTLTRDVTRNAQPSQSITVVESPVPMTKGDKGDKGDQGDAATIAVGTVTTVNPDDPATVTNSGTAGAAIFDFEIPKGETGPPADITNAAVNTAIQSDPGASRTALGGGTAGQAVFGASAHTGSGSTRKLMGLDVNDAVTFGQFCFITSSGFVNTQGFALNSGTFVVNSSGDITGVNLTIKPGASRTPASNGQIAFEATSDTSLTIKLKGSDGTVRSVVLTLT
jgi:hypothetical protein